MRTRISGKELKVFSLEDTELAPFRAPLIAWFNEHAAQAVLVRPDCYVFGTGNRCSAAVCVAGSDDIQSLQALKLIPAFF
jgi:hypothetical protein